MILQNAPTLVALLPSPLHHFALESITAFTMLYDSSIGVLSLHLPDTSAKLRHVAGIHKSLK